MLGWPHDWFFKEPDTQRRYVEIGKLLDGLTVQEARWLLGWLHNDVAIYGVHELLRDVMKEKEEKEEAEPPGSSTADKIMNDFLKKG